jgi:polyisoprenoid-binding protein YceI
MSAVASRATGSRALVTCLCAGWLLSGPAPSEAQQANVDFTVSGTSTIRGWTCTAKGVIAVTPGTGNAIPVPGFARGVESATVTVPVKTFTCPNSEMTEHLLQALKAEKFPQIVYSVDKYDAKDSQLQATGTLTIIDVKKGVGLPITLRAAAAGVEVEGNARLDMTAFGVEPPVVMGGLLKVGPQIRIHFKGLVTP